MKHSKDIWARCALSVAISGCLSATTVSAQEGVIEEVIVTGIRASLTASADIKRESSGVVDAITAEDIGKFADTNLAESLQRITGVSIDRSNNEGNQVSVRGFGPTFNLVTLNGRQMPTASTLSTDIDINRSFNFQHIASESVSGVEVYKTGKAHVPSGGIGATINLKTAKPFDLGELTLSGTLKGIADQSNENGDDITPEAAILFSNVFADGKFGALVSLSRSERDSRREFVAIDGWIQDTGGAYSNVNASGIDATNNPDGRFWVPRNFNVGASDHERTRNNAQVVLQFAPSETFTASIDYTASRFDEDINTTINSFWFDSDSGTTGTADANGTVTNPRHKNHRLNFITTNNVIETENDSFGLNLEWQVNDALTLTLDAHNSTSETQPSGAVSEFTSVLSTPPDERFVDIGLDINGNDVPAVTTTRSTTTEPEVAAGPIPTTGIYALENIDGDVVVARGNKVDNNIRQFQLSGNWENLSDNALQNIQFGISNTDYQFDIDRRFGFAVIPADQLNIQGLGVSFESANIGSAFSGSDQLFTQQLNVNPTTVNQDVIARSILTENPVRQDGVNEETFAAFLAFDFATEFNGIPLKANIGLRYEDTDVSAFSLNTLPTGIGFLTSVELRPVFADGQEPQIETLRDSYTEFLPNFDLSMEFTPDITGRFSYSRTLTRSDVLAIVPGTNITTTRPSSAGSAGIFKATQGNPGLLPYTSDNIDLSLEWYYAEGSYASIGYFKKYVDNFIGTNETEGTINGADGLPLKDPSRNPRPNCPPADSSNLPDTCTSQAGDPEILFEISTPSNIEDTEVDGLEFAVQHLLGDTGFGGIINYTFVDGDVEFDPFSFVQPVSLTGLSDSANLVLFYDKNGIQTRLAYNWRDEFLFKTSQFQGSPSEPQITKAFGQFDLSASYELNENITLVFEGLNILGETAEKRGRFANQFLSAEDFGRRFSFGARASF